MPTRYYILEGDATTAGGIVQKTTNTLSFKVYGKNQSYIGDDVWCPACQSMGKIIPDQDRLSTKVNGRMPALNDDLCLCKCSPPPKLVHSQTTFKEILDGNTLAQYQQTQGQSVADDTVKKYNIHVQFISEDDIPYANIDYIAKNITTDKIYHGITDKNGCTQTFYSDNPNDFEIKLNLDWQE